MDLTSRRLHPEDWEIFRDFRVRSIASAPEALSARIEEGLLDDMQFWQRQLQDEGWFVATNRAAEAVGVIGVVVHDSYVEEWTISGLWVEPAARGAGAARLLLAAACRHCKSLGLKSARLGVFQDNEAALRLVNRFGFKRELIRPSFSQPHRIAEFFVLDLGQHQDAQD